ncbi:MAG: amidohydrolase [Mangrovibacterium sp.]
MSDDLLHLALIQTQLVWENAPENRFRFEELFYHVPAETELIVLPEMFTTGFSMNPSVHAETMDGDTLKWMKSQADLHGKVIAGSIAVREKGHFYNRFVFARPGGLTDTYDKRHLFSVGQEQLHYTHGSERRIFLIKSFRILPLICYDLRFPVFCRNGNDYDLLINCANWPASRRNVWEILLKARAIENQVYVAGVNRIGVDANQISYSGNSMIVDPKGKSLASGEDGKEMILTATLSKSSLLHFREKFPVLPDADHFSLHF